MWVWLKSPLWHLGLASTMELLAPANLTGSAVARSVLQLSKVVRIFSWVNHKIINFSIAESFPAILSVFLDQYPQGISVLLYSTEIMKSFSLFLRALANGDLEKTLIVSDNCPTTFLFV